MNAKTSRTAGERTHNRVILCSAAPCLLGRRAVAARAYCGTRRASRPARYRERWAFRNRNGVRSEND